MPGGGAELPGKRDRSGGVTMDEKKTQAPAPEAAPLQTPEVDAAPALPQPQPSPVPPTAV